MKIKIAAGTPLPASFGRARGPSRAADPVGLEVPFEPHNGAHGVTRPTFRIRALSLHLCVSAVMFLFGLLACQAQSYSIDWHKIAGGGGISSNGQYTVSGTIGQHDATANAALTGGGYSVTGGFWALISVVQTPGAPTLYISHSGNTVTVYWQAVTGWTNLEQNSSLSAPAGWTTNTDWTTANGTNSLSLTSPSENLFFRLKQ